MLYYRKCKKGFGKDYAAFSYLAVFGSTLTALTVGFGFAALLALHAGLGWSVGDWWTPTLQAHGHAQLIGWLGLFITGVSLFFVPRLSGVPLKYPRLIVWAVGLLLSGVILRTVIQPLLVYTLNPVFPFFLPLSALLEAGGITLYLFLILSSVLRASQDRTALSTVLPFLVSTVIGWSGFAYLNIDLSFTAWADEASTYNIEWTRLSTDLFLGATLISVCLAFSIRTFPLYLRLPAANWAVREMAIAYVMTFLVSWTADASSGSTAWKGARFVSGLANASWGILLVLLVWKLDVLLRLRDAWTADQIAQASDGSRPTRPGLPDHGEFGRFERLLYLAYTWLVVGGLLTIYLGVWRVIGLPDPVDADSLRHVFLAGFVSSLLIGMAPRMVPGFVHQRQVAFPGLVNVTFWLWLVATLARLMPLLLDPVLPATAWVASLSGISFGLSGIVGWLAILLLTINLLLTLKAASDESRTS